MFFKLSKNDFQVLEVYVIEAKEYLEDIQKSSEEVIFKIENENLQEVQLLINDEIVLNGMDNQNTVNKVGIKLYRVYDEILYQKNNQV